VPEILELIAGFPQHPDVVRFGNSSKPQIVPHMHFAPLLLGWVESHLQFCPKEEAHRKRGRQRRKVKTAESPSPNRLWPVTQERRTPDVQNPLNLGRIRNAFYLDSQFGERSQQIGTERQRESTLQPSE
jgi:hypothetical protein